MALEAVVYPPQGSFPFAYYASNYIDSDFCFLDPNIHQWDTSSSSFSHHPNYNLDNNSNSSPDHQASSLVSSSHPLPAPGPRRKRRRTRTTKNRDEIENQRMTHIAVERNRRKQMNDYLAVLRSLMPSSYVQRGDQASIVGGSINFVKELEQLLQSMEAQKHNSNSGGAADSSSDSSSSSSSSPFSDFFTFPQYSTAARALGIPNNINKHEDSSGFRGIENGGVADIEVTMVESHANIKILTKKRARQLLKVVAMFQNLSLSVLHLSLTTTLDQMVLYSLSVKAEEGCHLNTVDEIAAAVNQILTKIQEEAGAFS